MRLRGLLRSVLVLLSGQSLAQLIAFAISPVLTRLYSPDDFGFLREVLAWGGVFVGIAALRFDMAIPLPRGQRVAASLLHFGDFWVRWIALLAALVAVGGTLAGLANFPTPLWALATGGLVWLTGSFNVGRWWSIRTGNFSVIARASIFGACVSAGVKSLAGYFVGSGEALVIAHLVGLTAAWSWMRASCRKDTVLHQQSARDSRWMRGPLVFYYREFPSYHAPMTLANNFAQHLPVFVIGALFTQSVVGHWSLAVMVGKMPVVMLATSVSHVFLKDAADELRRGRSIVRNWLFVTGLMSGLALIYGLGVWFLAEPVVPLLFGEEWVKAARFLKSLLPWTVMIIVASPSMGLIAPLRLQRSMLVVQVLSVGAILTLSNALAFGNDSERLVTVIAMTMGTASFCAMILAFTTALRRAAR